MWSPNWYKSDHEILKQNYSRYMLISAFGALVITGLGFIYSPPYVPAPTTLPEETINKPFVIHDPFYIPPVPKPITFYVEPSRIWVEDPFALPGATIDPNEGEWIFVSPPTKTVPRYDPIPDQLPQIVHFEPIEYPALAVDVEADGEVYVIVVVGTDGRVLSARIKSSTASDILEIAALKSALKCLFEPAKQRSQPVECQVCIPYSFALN